MEDQSLKEQFERELENIQSKARLSPEQKKRKFIFWCIRTLIAIVLYVIFWKHQWVRWSLIIYIPLNLLSLFAIYGSNFLLQKKIERTRRKIEEAEKQN